MKITDNSNPTEVGILINNISHLKFLKKKYIGLQAWYHSKSDYRIEIYLKGAVIKLEYDAKEKWENVLRIINSQI